MTSCTTGRMSRAPTTKASSTRWRCTSTGIGNATHLNAERFRASAGIAAVHIPVKSGPEALTEVMSGRADFYFCPIGTALPFIRNGKLRSLVISAPSPGGRIARRADYDGGRVCRCGLHLMDRSVRAGKDSTRHRRSASQ